MDAADLLVYKNKAAFDKRNGAVDGGKEESLKEDSLSEAQRKRNSLSSSHHEEASVEIQSHWQSRIPNENND